MSPACTPARAQPCLHGFECRAQVLWATASYVLVQLRFEHIAASFSGRVLAQRLQIDAEPSDESHTPKLRSSRHNQLRSRVWAIFTIYRRDGEFAPMPLALGPPK